MFEDQKIDKTYHAVTIGLLKDKGTIKIDINKKPCITEFNIITRLSSKKYSFLNLVELIPYTGRRHQLRIHLSEIGSPIFGDIKYGKEGLIGKGNGLYLYASSLSFSHPFISKRVFAEIPLPKKILKIFPKGLK